MKDNINVLLVLLPFWTPMIPPLGITGLKSFLQRNGFSVKTYDANIENDYKEIYDKYFSCLGDHIPEEKKGNYLSIGTDVLRNHLMAHINYTDKKKYIELVKLLIAKTYYIDAAETLVHRLIQTVEDFYRWLESYMLNLLEKEKPGVLGLSVYKDILPAALYAFRLTRQRYPHIKTVIGGSVFSEQLTVDSPDLEFFLEKTRDYIDKIIIGEGELLFLEYLQGKLPETRRLQIANDVNTQQLDLSQLPVPDYSDIEMERYPYLGFTGSVSCPYQCSFCNVVSYFGRFKQKNPARMVDDMQRLYDLYGRQVFYLSDNMVNPFIFELARECLTRDRVVYWAAYLKVDKYGCDPDNTFLWRQAGFYHARLGLDNGSQRILNMMDKRITVEQSKTMIASLAEAGIKTTTYWLIGHPGETEADFQQTLDFLSECKNNIWEAECEYFNYNYSGQSHSQQWGGRRKLVYPADARDMLMVNKWAVDGEPSREEIMNRVCRFVRHCDKLGIPNPYSLREIYLADQRWKALHPSAVPPLMEFRSEKGCIEECRSIRKPEPVENTLEFSGDFDI
jgi:hypothetical protein